MKIILIIFLVIGTLFVLFTIKDLFFKKEHINKAEVEKDLQTINEQGSSPAMKSNAFIRLIKNSYILVHILVNSGNKYDDEIQKKSFCGFMNTATANKINNIEDNNGQYTF